MSTAQRVIAAAVSQVGYHEGYSNGHWNNQEKYAAQVPGLAWANGQPWCDVFVAWCFTKAGAANLIPVSASCAVSMAEWKRRGRWSEYPAVGAQVIYGGGEHTGIVQRFDAKYIWTIEGNTNTSGSPEGDGVYSKVHARTDPWVTGYGLPDYPEGIDSADPKFARRTPKPATKPAPKPSPSMPSVDAQTASNIATGNPVAKVKRPRVAARMRQIIARLRAGTEKK